MVAEPSVAIQWRLGRGGPDRGVPSPSEESASKNTLGPNHQRWLKLFHLIIAGIWTGVAFGILLLNVSMDAEEGMALYGIDACMKFLDDFAVVPGLWGFGAFQVALLSFAMFLSVFKPWKQRMLE